MTLAELLETELVRMQSAILRGARGDSQVVASMLNIKYQLEQRQHQLDHVTAESVAVIAMVYAVVDIELTHLGNQEVVDVARSLLALIKQRAGRHGIVREG